MKGGDSKSRVLSKRELERYSRNMLIPEWGGNLGQEKLKGSTVLVAGAGGSGSSLLIYLAAAGVGHIRICDGDKVNISNLNRQIIHDEGRIGFNKAESARETLVRLNSDIEVTAFPVCIDEKNAGEMAHGCNLICSAVDDLKAMSILGRQAADVGIPMIWAGGYYMGGFLTFLSPPDTPCIDCCLAARERNLEGLRSGRIKLPADSAFVDITPNPIIGAAAGAAGAFQAMEAIKYLTGVGKNLIGILLTFQLGGAGMSFGQAPIDFWRQDGCPRCGRPQ